MNISVLSLKFEEDKRKYSYIIGVVVILLILLLLYSFSDTREVQSAWYTGQGDQNWSDFNINDEVKKVRYNNWDNIMLEIDRNPTSEPTEEDIEGAWRLYKNSFEAAKQNNWFKYEEAISDRYYNDTNDPFHFPHKDYLTDGSTLNPEKPEFLMYYDHPEKNKKVLVGVMYQKSSFEEHGVQVGGSLTRWHRHIYAYPTCFDDFLPVGIHIEKRLQMYEKGEECAQGVKSSTSPEMIHIWFVDHPVSQFDTGMSIPQELIEEPEMLSKEEFVQRET